MEGFLFIVKGTAITFAILIVAQFMLDGSLPLDVDAPPKADSATSTK